VVVVPVVEVAGSPVATVVAVSAVVLHPPMRTARLRPAQNTRVSIA
jgi:hypothetical protein